MTQGCDTGTDETQEYLEVCTGFSHEQRGLKMNDEKGKLIFWRRMASKLKALTNEDNLKDLKKIFKLKQATTTKNNRKSH